MMSHEITTGDKVNLLFIMIQTNLGGSERVVLDLASHIDRFAFRVYVAYFIPGTLDKAFREVCDGMFHIRKGPGVDLRAALHLSQVIRDNEIHVANAHHYMCFFYGYLAGKVLTRRGLVYTEHSVPEVEGITGMHKPLFNAFMRRTDAVVGVSQGISDAFRSRFPSHSGKIKTILNGVDVSRFALEPGLRRKREDFGLLPEHFVIGMIANFRRVKNHACLVRAFHRLSERHPHVRLVMVGRGFSGDPENTVDEVKDLIHRLRLDDKVVMAGYREDVRQVLSNFDVFCLPSFSEGLPMSVLEAMAANVAVVGSDVRGNREALSHGETGLLFPSNDDGALSRALDDLVTNGGLRTALREKAFTFVSSVHGVDRWVSSYEHLFRSVALRNSRYAGLPPSGAGVYEKTSHSAHAL